jgi:hypothetical protein
MLHIIQIIMEQNYFHFKKQYCKTNWCISHGYPNINSNSQNIYATHGICTNISSLNKETNNC